MVFSAPDGRREALWVEQSTENGYRVLSVPVWVYGISVGSVVQALDAGAGELIFDRIVTCSSGATVRFVTSQRNSASNVYLQRILPDAGRLSLMIGPATFFDPKLVAFHVRDRQKWWPDVGGYLDALVREGILEQWEVADPDEYPEGGTDSAELRDDVLRHPLPVEGQPGQHVS